MRRAYLGLCERLAPRNPENWKKNVTVANSRWTAGLLEREFGLIARRVQFPPVPGNFPAVSWNERENRFVCNGRVVPGLRVEEYWRKYYEVRNCYFLRLYRSPRWRAALGFVVNYVRGLGVIIIVDNNKLYRCRLLTKAFVDALRGKTGMRVGPYDFHGKYDPRPTA